MSWQPYIDRLTQSGYVSKASIHGHDGSVYATSPGFNVSQEEFKQIYAGFSDPDGTLIDFQHNGFVVAGNRYTLTQINDIRIYGKNTVSQAGVACCKTNKTVIIAYWDGNTRAQHAWATVEKWAAHLRLNDY